MYIHVTLHTDTLTIHVHFTLLRYVLHHDRICYAKQDAWLHSHWVSNIIPKRQSLLTSSSSLRGCGRLLLTKTQYTIKCHIHESKRCKKVVENRRINLRVKTRDDTVPKSISTQQTYVDLCWPMVPVWNNFKILSASELK
jgi:hypothetical protein